MSTTRATFDLASRERFLAMLSANFTIEAAASVAGTSRQTVNRWVARGRAPDASAEHRSFAERFDAIRAEFALSVEEEEAPRDEAAEQAWKWVLDGDPFVGITPDELATLTLEQQKRARAVSAKAHKKARPRARKKKGG